jgi:hypothetical protein
VAVIRLRARAKQKWQSLFRGPAIFFRVGTEFVACSDEALPFTAVALQSAMRCCVLIADTIVQEISDCNQCQHDSDHGAPSFWLSLNINAQIAAQMFIGVIARKVRFTGIDMAFVPVIKVVLNIIAFHRITSLIYYLTVC